MKVLLVSNYENDRQESMLRFAAALAEGLAAAGVEAKIARPEAFFGRFRAGATGLGKYLGYLDKFLLFPSRLRRLAAEADLIHICDHSNAMYVNDLAGRPHLVTCNDLLAVRSALGEFPQNRTGWSGRILQRWILRSLCRAQRVTCISEASRRDVLRLTGSRLEEVSTTYMGQNYPYAPVREVAEAAELRRRAEPFDAEVLPRWGVPQQPYILHVGGAQWYKNRPSVVEMHRTLAARLGERSPRLLLVGPPLAAPNVEVRTSVDNTTLAALYSGAELLLFPSLEEGFGWPIIEAQACGCRVLTTDKDPMREVGGNAAKYLADPMDINSGAIAIETLLAQDAAERESVQRAGFENAARFSRERMIEEYVKIYREILAV